MKLVRLVPNDLKGVREMKAQSVQLEQPGPRVQPEQPERLGPPDQPEQPDRQVQHQEKKCFSLVHRVLLR